MSQVVALDLDQTLIDAVPLSKTGTQIDLGAGETYGVFVRPGAYDLLAALEDRGNKIVLCTTSTQQYANLMTDAFTFGFKTIYARTELDNPKRVKIEERGKCFLIDDREPWELRKKFELLHQIVIDQTPQLVKLIKVNPWYSCWPSDGFDAATIKRIMGIIYE